MDLELAEFFILMCGAATVALIEEEEVLAKRKRIWVRNWVRRRDEEGCCAKLLKELRDASPPLYKNVFRMRSDEFDNLFGCNIQMKKFLIYIDKK